MRAKPFCVGIESTDAWLRFHLSLRVLLPQHYMTCVYLLADLGEMKVSRGQPVQCSRLCPSSAWGVMDLDPARPVGRLCAAH